MPFKKGDPSINRNGRPKLSEQARTLKELAGVHTEAALAIIVAIANDKTAPKQVRLNACIELLDRGHGRPAQSVGISNDIGIPAPVIVVEMADPKVAQRLLSEFKPPGSNGD